jgi:phosphoribosylglycinamide formyltransferase-1
VKVGVLVSGGGTNLQALVDTDLHPASVVFVGCNRAGAPAIARASAAGVPVCVVDRNALPRRRERQQRLLAALEQADVELVVLAGFDEILIPEVVAAYAGRIINTHPSLLPAFGGSMHAVADTLAYGVRVTGCTIHVVTDEVDAGPIVFQACLEVQEEDDVAALHARIRTLEHRLLPQAVRAFAEGRVLIEGRRARVIRS